jgi:hypothetical protein
MKNDYKVRTDWKNLFKIKKIKENKFIDFEFTCGSARVKLKEYFIVTDWDIIQKCDSVIQIFLTMLGDKAIFHTGYGRELKINWR